MKSIIEQENKKFLEKRQSKLGNNLNFKMMGSKNRENQR